MVDPVIQEQIAYYRARAGEYDEWFYRKGRYDRGEALNGQWFDEVAQVTAALRAAGRAGSALELACGTGIWTQELVKLADRVTAVDASPEMIAINRAKLQADTVDYVQADLFAWEPEREYDLVFFAFWLSHVPPETLDEFLAKAARAVRPGGRLFLVDSRHDPTSTAVDHVLPDQEATRLTRKLNDGRTFTIIKVFYKPDDLHAHLERAGLSPVVRTTSHYFIYADAVKR